MFDALYAALGVDYFSSPPKAIDHGVYSVSRSPLGEAIDHLIDQASRRLYDAGWVLLFGKDPGLRLWHHEASHEIVGFDAKSGSVRGWDFHEVPQHEITFFKANQLQRFERKPGESFDDYWARFKQEHLFNRENPYEYPVKKQKQQGRER
ncbi:hypothetical protein SAMN00768000_3087 [Sulfobacillus thermosulfidooxidans DSM 9293]|uniref:Uncharacterized protein n=2 Tax=Sulfobacillus thermosulfidooxidans TaxID=28034 RepID=A0A1W1WL41_SULTA|nr:hypothetical protein [Sulfobacillus thermosulfidooxidans]PSR21710.1 MAG: hypothetical protein C7B47_17150 [Sulfobacillus thermosulfidooxidans]SMC06899.1 hypothetical protein SAMN00768000_3087 [Sulfobacillus thermosulfidooxidans DSM 9293]